MKREPWWVSYKDINSVSGRSEPRWTGLIADKEAPYVVPLLVVQFTEMAIRGFENWALNFIDAEVGQYTTDWQRLISSPSTCCPSLPSRRRVGQINWDQRLLTRKAQLFGSKKCMTESGWNHYLPGLARTDSSATSQRMESPRYTGIEMGTPASIVRLVPMARRYVT